MLTQRWPIGRVDVPQHATPEQLRGFYQREYRPDNAVLIAVGNFDPALMHSMIEARFTDWSASAPGPRARLEPGRPAEREATAALFTESAAPMLANIAFVRPYDDSADTDAIASRNIKRSLAVRIFEDRLTALAQKADAPISGASRSAAPA